MGILSQMKDTFTADLQEAREKEATDGSSHKKLKATKETEIKNSEDAIAKKTQRKAEKNQEASDKTQQVRDIRASMEGDLEFLEQVGFGLAMGRAIWSSWSRWDSGWGKGGGRSGVVRGAGGLLGWVMGRAIWSSWSRGAIGRVGYAEGDLELLGEQVSCVVGEHEGGLPGLSATASAEILRGNFELVPAIGRILGRVGQSGFGHGGGVAMMCPWLDTLSAFALEDRHPVKRLSAEKEPVHTDRPRDLFQTRRPGSITSPDT